MKILTQNVRGLVKTQENLTNCFSLLRGKDDGEQVAITLLQETHVLTEERAKMEREYRGFWGMNEHADQISFWSGTTDRTGGVGILLNPYQVTEARPTLEHLWSKYFIAITCKVKQQRVLVANVYAPQKDEKAREKLFQDITDSTPDFNGLRVLGGDFNCTQNRELDRSYTPRAAKHVSAELDNTIDACNVVDIMLAEMPTDREGGEVEEFYERHHTYKYTRQGRTESSRLDRIYVSAELHQWIGDPKTTNLGLGSDHAAVSVALSDPATRVTVTPRRKLYPPRRCAEQAVREECMVALERLDLTAQTPSEEEEAAPTRLIQQWVAFKSEIVKKIGQAVRQAVKKTNLSYKRRVNRLRQRIRAARLNEDDAAKGKELHTRLETTVREWQTVKRRRLSAKHNWEHRMHSTEFYKRVTASRDQAPIQQLDIAEGMPARRADDLLNIMTDAWDKVMNDPHEDEDPSAFLTSELPRLDPTTAAILDAPFTLEEVQKAIKRCSRSKSGGPDQLPNAWYQSGTYQARNPTRMPIGATALRTGTRCAVPPHPVRPCAEETGEHCRRSAAGRGIRRRHGTGTGRRTTDSIRYENLGRVYGSL